MKAQLRNCSERGRRDCLLPVVLPVVLLGTRAELTLSVPCERRRENEADAHTLADHTSPAPPSSGSRQLPKNV